MPEKIKCPVCGKGILQYDGDVCPYCDWFHDIIQEKYPDETNCENEMSLNEARAAWSRGEKVR